MSTILRALKKLEQDKEAPGARDLSHTMTTAVSAKNWPTGRFSSRSRLRAAIVAAAFIGVSGAAVYFYTQSKSASMQVSHFPDAVRKPVPSQVSAPARQAINRSDSGTPQSRPQPAQTKPAPQSKQLLGKPGQGGLESSGTRVQPVMPERIEPREDFEQDRNLPKAGSPIGAAAPKAGADAAMPAEAAPSANRESEDEPAYANAPRLTDNRLKIQAIAWSPIPDERMSVINSHIRREGDSVEGFLVVKIGTDDVIVREKGQLYRVVFGSP
jgi:hypothetical protein